MMRHTRCTRLGVGLLAFCLLAACAPQRVDASYTQERDSARRGLAYAEQACASCHGVQRGRASSPVPQAPAFETVANTPGMTELALNVWLHSAHDEMPDLMVDPDHVEDLWAYMASLAAHGASARPRQLTPGAGSGAASALTPLRQRDVRLQGQEARYRVDVTHGLGGFAYQALAVP